MAARASHRFATLTEREREVLHCVMEGLSNPEVASLLSLSTETVKSHLTHCIHKLGARDRTQAVVLALRTGQLELQGLRRVRLLNRLEPVGPTHHAASSTR
jgi:DNA-binding NarL/FixJ family response regulator